MRRSNPLRTLWLLAATLCIAAVLTPAVAVAQPAPQTTLSVSGQADYISPNQIIVYVTVVGTGGTGFVSVQVQQARPPFPPTSGSGSTSTICDGRHRTYAVSVFGFGGGWQLGDAEASVFATCPSGSDFKTKSLRITRP